MGAREELIQQAEAKFRREQLIKAAEAKYAQSQPKQSQVGLIEPTETFLRSAAEGLTLGASEPVVSSVKAGVQNLVDAGFEAKSAEEFVGKALSSESFEQNYQKDVDRRRFLKDQMPISDFTGTISSALIPLAPGKVGAAVKTVDLGGKLARTAAGGIQRAAQMLPGVSKLAANTGALGRIAGSAAEGGAIAVTSEACFGDIVSLWNGSDSTTDFSTK